MLLTIHNLPSTTRYQDVKSLLHEKCGLTDIIMDNLVNEGKAKKVTVGLANEDDGAFVVRKLNGLFINGQQLYIEHKRRNAQTVHEQPYRPSANFVQESRGFEQAHINNLIETAMAPNAPTWTQNVTAPYMPLVPVEQNVAYSGYVGVPQTPQYMEPRPVPVENERGYSGFQGDNYIPTVTSGGPGHQAPDWGRSGREFGPSDGPPPDAYRNNDRKRRHSPERPAAPRLSRKERMLGAQNRRQETAPAEPPRQWPEQGPPNQGPRPPFRQPEQLPRYEHENINDRYQPREPSPNYRRTDPQWERKRWDEPKPNPRSEREEWGNDNHRNWDVQPAKVWDNPPEQQWHEEPRRWDDEPKPQWEENYSSMPVEDNRPEWYDRREPEGPPHEDTVEEFRPRDQGQYREPRPRKSRFDDRDSGPNWNREPANRSVSRPAPSSNRQGRPAEEMQTRDRPRSKNGPPERQWQENRPNPMRDRSGGPNKPGFGRQGPKDFNEPKRQRPMHEFGRQGPKDFNEPKRQRPMPEFGRQGAKDFNESKRQRPMPEFNKCVTPKDQLRPAMPRHERDDMYRKKPFVKEEKIYPPRRPENKPQSLRAMINKDQSNRNQGTALIAKTVIGVPKGFSSYHAKTPLDSFVFKQLKLCIKSRIDVELGEELSTDMGEVIKRYRTKYPINQDKTLLKQIREKATKEFEENQERKRQENPELEGVKKEVKNEAEVKEEAETENNSKKEDVLNQARLEDKDETKALKGTTDSDKTTVKKVPSVPPNMPKKKPGQPLTDKQVIQQMKLQRKWEFDHDDLYSLDEVSNKALDDELAELEKLFTAECSSPDGPQEDAICKRITTDSLVDFHKAIRLYITKRFLNIPTGLSIRVFAQGKLPRKTAIKEYLKQYRIESMTLKKSVKGTMFMVNLSRFQDFDDLCRIEHDVIDGIPVNFKAMHLIGPPPKINRNQVKAMRERLIQSQIDPNIDLAEFEDTNFVAVGSADKEDNEDNEDEDNEDNEDKEEFEDFTEDIAETGNFEDEDGKDTADFKDDFGEDINIGNINEEDLEDF